MAEQAVNFVASVATSELAGRVFSGLIHMYRKDATTHEKLQRLRMLLIKIHSAIEASEKHTIKNSWLLQWREELMEAASQGDNALSIFLQWDKDSQCTSNTDANQQQGEADSSSAAAPATAVGKLSFTRNSLCVMVQGIRSAKMMISSGDDSMEMLNNALERLEKLSPDVREFVRLLHLVALPKVYQTPSSTSLSTEVHGPTKKIRKKRRNRKAALSTPSDHSSKPSLFSIDRVANFDTQALVDLERDLAVIQKELQLTILQDRLEAAFAAICKAIELAGRRNLEDLEWLTYWIVILGEAKKQGCAVLGAISARKSINMENNKESTVELDEDKDELSGFVHRLEGLASDVEYFNELVDLCEAC